MALKTTIIPSVRQIIYTTYAAFPTSGLTKGDLAWATDRKALYRWSGSAWQSVGISSRSGAYAAIGTPANYPLGSLYQATDTNTLYMQIGGAWVAIVTPALFSAQAVVTGSRAIDTVYQNTTGKTMYVAISWTHTSIIEVTAFSDSSTPPTTEVAMSQCQANYEVHMSFMVLPGNYYKLTASAGTPTLDHWVEWY